MSDLLLLLFPENNVPQTGNSGVTPLPQHSVTFSTPGADSWTAPVDIRGPAVCEGIGGGGKMGTPNATAARGGAGGGAYALCNFSPVAGQVFVLNIGAGATANGTSGGSSFMVDAETPAILMLAQGGGTNTKTNTSGGVGGSSASSIGQIKFSGGAGGTGTGVTGAGGGSSASAAGVGTLGGDGDGTTTGGAGGVAPAGGGNGGDGGVSNTTKASAGVAPGGGGGGAGKSASGTNGNGGNGQITITYRART